MMEQLTRCNHCGYEYLVALWDPYEEPRLGYVDGEEFVCPACGSEDTTCI